jgi:hypothetical protein
MTFEEKIMMAIVYFVAIVVLSTLVFFFSSNVDRINYKCHATNEVVVETIDKKAICIFGVPASRVETH